MYESTAELGTPDNCRDNVTGYANKLVLVALTMHGNSFLTPSAYNFSFNYMS